MVTELLERRMLHDALTHDASARELIQEAEDEKLELAEYFQIKSPERDGTAYPESAMEDYLCRRGLRVRATRSHGTSSLGDFMKNEGDQAILWAVCDEDFDRAAGLDQVMERNINSFAEAEAQTAFRPTSDKPLYERYAYRPKITIGDIAFGVETIDKPDFRQPEFTTRKLDAESQDLAEGAPTLIQTLSFAQELGETKTFGGGMRWSDKFALEDLAVSLLRMYVRKFGAVAEGQIVNEGLWAIMDNGPATAVLDPGTGAWSFDDILDFALFDGTPDSDFNAYQITGLFCQRAEAKEIIQGYATDGDPGVFSQYPTQYFGNLFPGIQVLNAGLGTPTVLGVLRDNAVANITGDRILGIDARYAAQLQVVRRGMQDETERDPKTRFTNRYMTRMIGWLIADPDASFPIDVS